MNIWWIPESIRVNLTLKTFLLLKKIRVNEIPSTFLDDIILETDEYILNEEATKDYVEEYHRVIVIRLNKRDQACKEANNYISFSSCEVLKRRQIIS